MLYLTAYQSGFPLFGSLFTLIVKVFGYLMNGIYIVLDKIGIPNVGLAIIIFTLITRIILYPSTVKQQKSSKIMNIIQPEIKAIQAKYEGLKDQQSMMMQQQEMKAVYEKYGTSMTGNCVQLLIQMPIILALYRVIMNIPAYVPQVKEKFLNIFNLINTSDLVTKIKSFCTGNQTLENEIKGIDTLTGETLTNKVIDFLNKLNPMQMNEFATKFNNSSEIMESYAEVEKVNSFLGLNLSTAPSAYGFNIQGLIIPVLAALSQYLSVQVMQAQTKKKTVNGVEEEPDQMQQTMKSMNIMMPLISAWFCWQFASGIGIYWIASSIFMMITYMIVNKQFENMDIDEMIKKNIEKVNAKRAKKGLPPVNEVKATETIKKMEETTEKRVKEREEKINEQIKKTEEANKFYFENENPDSLFAKANMVQKYNEKHNK